MAISWNKICKWPADKCKLLPITGHQEDENQKPKEVVHDTCEDNYCPKGKGRCWEVSTATVGHEMGVPQILENSAPGLEECLSGRAPTTMSKALHSTDSTTENHEIETKTEIPHYPTILLLGISTKKKDQSVTKNLMLKVGATWIA